jgi:hypothetical protein
MQKAFHFYERPLFFEPFIGYLTGELEILIWFTGF